ncbi:MAG: nucleotide exchange factor GrpE [bacterium]|nr:nucleotide exchange factor GrpE [bacterium]
MSDEEIKKEEEVGVLEKCEKEKKDYLDGWQRAKADFLNYKKDEGRRLEDMAKFVISGLIQDILPIMDSFDLALGHDLSKESERGVLLIRSQFEDVLKKRGLEQIKTESGDNFNPEVHESIGEVESEHTEGTVAEVVQKGYRFRERVIRPARVRLAKNKK